MQNFVCPSSKLHIVALDASKFYAHLLSVVTAPVSTIRTPALIIGPATVGTLAQCQNQKR
jgi:hypothetical protein